MSNLPFTAVPRGIVGVYPGQSLRRGVDGCNRRARPAAMPLASAVAIIKSRMASCPNPARCAQFAGSEVLMRGCCSLRIAYQDKCLPIEVAAAAQGDYVCVHTHENDSRRGSRSLQAQLWNAPLKSVTTPVHLSLRHQSPVVRVRDRAGAADGEVLISRGSIPQPGADHSIPMRSAADRKRAARSGDGRVANSRLSKR
jgi:hypothetical protein